MTITCSLNLNLTLAEFWRTEFECLDNEGFARFVGYGGLSAHGWGAPLLSYSFFAWAVFTKIQLYGLGFIVLTEWGIVKFNGLKV